MNQETRSYRKSYSRDGPKLGGGFEKTVLSGSQNTAHDGGHGTFACIRTICPSKEVKTIRAAGLMRMRRG